MNANVKRTLAAAIKAAQAVNTASDKLASSTAKFVTACGGFDEAAKVLNAQRETGRTWKHERSDNSPLWRVYNCVAAAKSRAKQAEAGQSGRAGRAGQTGKEAGKEAGQTGKEAGKEASTPATKPATPADIMAVVLCWTPAQIAQAVNDQTAVLTASAIDTLTEVLGLLINSTPTAPRKTAPRKTTRKTTRK